MDYSLQHLSLYTQVYLVMMDDLERNDRHTNKRCLQRIICTTAPPLITKWHILATYQHAPHTMQAPYPLWLQGDPMIQVGAIQTILQTTNVPNCYLKF